VIDPDSPLVLGSGSPRRRAILTGLGIPLRVVRGDAEERVGDGEAPGEYLERVVAEKLASVAARLGEEPFDGVLVADTIVLLDGEILGKPHDLEQARATLARLVGRDHWVRTRYAIARASDPRETAAARTVETRVHMRAAAPDEIERYAATGEGLDKAGAYAAQGIGAFLVERIDGSYTNVVGLPACELVLDLRALGLLPRFP
jgi:septum formation protein